MYITAEEALQVKMLQCFCNYYQILMVKWFTHTAIVINVKRTFLEE